jgi:hypothetical protein
LTRGQQVIGIPDVPTGFGANMKGGRPKGSYNKPRPIDVEAAIEAAADNALTGKPIVPGMLKGRKRSIPSKADCERLTRSLGVSMEEFNQRLGEKLALISDKIATRIEEKLDNDEFKAGELGFIFSVSEDKRRALDVRAQMGASQVNIQVNNYGDKSRDEIIAALTPEAMSAPAPIEIDPNDVI